MSREDAIRKEALFQLYAVRPLVRDAAGLAREARKQMLDFSAAEFMRECEFLADEGLLVRQPEPGTTGRLYRIHAAGVRHYEQTYAS